MLTSREEEPASEFFGPPGASAEEPFFEGDPLSVEDLLEATDGFPDRPAA
jgi:hypothetical protein